MNRRRHASLIAEQKSGFGGESEQPFYPEELPVAIKKLLKKKVEPERIHEFIDTIIKIVTGEAEELERLTKLSMLEKLSLSLAEVHLPVRIINFLEARAIYSIEQLLNCPREQLLAIPNLGDKGLEQIFDALAAIGIKPKQRTLLQEPDDILSEGEEDKCLEISYAL